MAELLVWTEDKAFLSGDSKQDRHAWRAGDVICINDDGHAWSERESSHPKWKIIKFPGIAKELLSQLTAPDLGYLEDEAELLSQTLQRRAFRLKLDEKSEIKTIDQILALIEKKTPLRAANIIGEIRVFSRGKVIG